MKNLLLLFVLALLVTLPVRSIAQCTAGEVELTIDVMADGYGYEGYWQLTPTGSPCGTGTIDEGGNLTIGCNGGGLQNQNMTGYGNNQTYTEGPWCVTQGGSYTLHYVDDYGDGGFDFAVKVNGFIINTYTDNGNGATFIFTAQEPPALDASANVFDFSTPIQEIYIQPAPFTLKANITNNGMNTINSLTMNYRVNNGLVVSAPVTGLNIANSQTNTVSHPTPWNPSSDGTYNIKIWASDLNGSADNNPSNDTALKIITVGPGIPNYIDGYIGAAATFTNIVTASNQVNMPTDIDFHSILSNNQLWVINKETEANGGTTVIVSNAGETNQTSQYKEDGNGWHFMSLPTGIAFGTNGNFATSPGVVDANHDGGQPFTGPALWSGDLDVFAQPSGGNGSHLDMLHESPQSQGIAWERDNVYWVFDGYNQDIVRYDFAKDHDPGNDDHSDAIIHRYADSPMYMDAQQEVVSHLVLDDNKQWLYVVNTGINQIFRMDITTGNPSGTPGFGPHEAIAEYQNYSGYTQQIMVDSGLMNPSGIDVVGNRMIVGNYGTNQIIIYDITNAPAVELFRINTQAQGIQGVKVGPDGKIYYADFNGDKVVRVDAAGVGIEETDITSELNIYPNPSDGMLLVRSAVSDNVELTIYNAIGQQVFYDKGFVLNTPLQTSFDAGVYIVETKDENGLVARTKWTVQ